MKFAYLPILLFSSFATFSNQAQAIDDNTNHASLKPDTTTKVVFLGSGFPRPDPKAAGPSLAITVQGHAYLVDAGAGVVRRAAEAYTRGEYALGVDNLNMVFLTHLHSDHTLGLPDLLFTPWVVGRTKPLTVIGPKGAANMMQKIEEAWAEDIHVRVSGGEGGNKTGYKAVVKEVESGVVFKDENITVTAFRVPHGNWEHAFGFRFDTPDKSIVVSGDTSSAPDVIKKYCNGCDILIHEAFAGTGTIENTFTQKQLGHPGADWATYMKKYHTSGEELGVIAKGAGAKRVVVTHTILLGKATEQDLIAEIKKNYNGPVQVAKDLDAL